MRPNKNLSFCSGAIINGEPQPFTVGSGAKQCYCHNLLLSIANPRVYHSVLHSGSDSTKEFGLHTFPKSVLQQIAAAPGIQCLSPFALPLHPSSGSAPDAVPTRTAIPKNPTIRFGAHRAPYTEAPRLPSWLPSPRRPRIQSANLTHGTSCKSPSSLKSWTRSFRTTRNSSTVWRRTQLRSHSRNSLR